MLCHYVLTMARLSLMHASFTIDCSRVVVYIIGIIEIIICSCFFIRRMISVTVMTTIWADHCFAQRTAALSLCAGMAQADFTLHILHINDLHSRIESVNKYDSTCGAEDEAEGKCFGGVARVATKIN